MEKKKQRSKNATINAGYFQGLQEEVHRRTGITKPVIYKAIKENDGSSPKKLQAIKVALALIEERNQLPGIIQEPIAEYNKINPAGFFTYWDYLKWQFEERVELIRGKIFKMAPAPNTGHQSVSFNLTLEIGGFFKKQPCRVFTAPFDVRLPVPKAEKDSTVVQPDICVICDESKIESKGCNGAPDLIVEILSNSNQQHDLHVKYELYEACGVPEYWIIDPFNKLVLIYCLEKGKYAGLKPITTGMVAQGKKFKELKINVDDIFYRTEFV